jgi:hypothetical protein
LRVEPANGWLDLHHDEAWQCLEKTGIVVKAMARRACAIASVS